MDRNRRGYERIPGKTVRSFDYAARMIQLLEQLEANGSRDNSCRTQPLGTVGRLNWLECPL